MSTQEDYTDGDVVLNRSGSRKLNGLARGDSVKRLPQLGRLDNREKGSAANGNLQPNTPYEKLQAWMINEGNRVIFFSVWIILHALVFSLAFVNYVYHDDLNNARTMFGITYPIARAAALVLHVDAAMVLFPVCRNLISLFRTTSLNNIIPFDKNIQFHKQIGISIFVFTWIHTIAHWINFARAATELNGGFVLWLKLNFTTGPGLTGYVMLICLMVITFTSIEKQRKRHYNRFWYLHHLFIPFFACWAFHGAFCMIPADREPKCKDIAVFWKYWIASGVIYIGERILREVRGHQPTYISKVIMHPSKVVEIQIRKPHMVTKAGQYIFLACPDISLFQWHPFTLTSAPEEDYLSVHIRVVGDFTNELAKRLGCNFDEEKRRRSEVRSTASGIEISMAPDLKNSLPRVMIDGPYGSASEDVFKFEVAMLVGAGIGVTPFASILKSIWYRVNYPTKSTKLRKAYFLWICRDYKAFEWFRSLLAAIEEQDLDNFIEVQIYLTGGLNPDEIDNIMVNDDGTAIDALTGLRSPTHYGRPVWDKIFQNMRDLYPATDVGVFFCGPKPLGKQLHTKCNLWSQGFEDGTRFFYGKENF
ncbi:11249_t:CDS:2 [Paraglomus occultum]|uniref:11249_t:CDS:1 n=1 Tax=Paraglomus occultum TaxID=144539 RepID=A0A9N8W5I7_9GLOM|nr:11249_t:CDS:2 [Paraglomus occultum]